MEIAKIIKPSFSTADADYPNICQFEDDLLVVFTDWREIEVKIRFVNVIAFKWQMTESYIDGEEYDGCHEIVNSIWLAENYKQGTIGKSEAFKHYKFNFNACGQLEVLASEFKTET